MLYDKRWDYKVKADPFTLESLIAWLEKRLATGRYSYVTCGHCLLAQYFTDCGFIAVRVTPKYLLHQGGNVVLPMHFNSIAVGDESLALEKLSQGWTFGAALDRARKLADASCLRG